MLTRMFPSPSPGTRGGPVFRAPRLWEFNVCGALVAGIGGAVVLCVVAAILIRSARSVGWLPAFLILDVVAGGLLLFPGNLAAIFPYAAEIVEGEGLWFYAPFKRVYVPLEEIKGVRWSYARTGWVVRLRKRHGLLSRLVIHAAWGSRGRDLASAIEQELGHGGA